MTHKSNLHQRFMEAKQQVTVAEPTETAHGEAVTPANPAPVEAPVEAVPASVVTEDLDANVLATGPRSVVCIQPNPSNAQATADAYKELERAQTERLDNEFEATTEGLRELRDQIKVTNAAGGFSPEAAYFAGVAIEALTTRIAHEDPMLAAAVESALDNIDGKSMISTESLDYTLEGVDNVARELGKRWISTLHRMVTDVWTSVKVNGMGLDSLAKKANGIKATGGSVKVKKAYVMEGKDVAKDAGASFIKAAEILKFLTGPFSRQAAEDYNYNSNLLHVAHLEIMDGKWFKNRDEYDQAASARLPQLLEKWRDPRKKIGGNPSDPIVGNYVFFKDQSLKYKGDNAAAKKFDELANHAYPTLITYQHESAEGDGGKVTIPALTPQQIVTIANQLREACKAFSYWRAMSEKLSASPIGNTIGLFAKHERRDSGSYRAVVTGFFNQPELETVKDALETSNRLRFHVGYDAGRALVKTIKHFKKIAKLSLKAHAQASVESWDQATASDGDSVNETSPIEPTQAPGAEQQAPEGEVQPKQTTFQDNPESKQDLNGNVQPTIENENGSPVEKFDNTDTSVNTTDVKEVQPATADTTQQVTDAKLTGSAPTGVTEEAAAKADEHADGTPAAAVEPVGGDTDASVKDAKLGGEAPTGVTEPAAADADNKADDAVQADAVQSVGGDTTQTVKSDASLKGVAVESMQGPAIRVPYWFGSKQQKK